MKSFEKIKRIKSFIGVFVAGILSLIMGSCSDDDLNTQIAKNDLANVSFELDASMLNLGVISRAITPIYNAGGFGIYAFKQGDDGNFNFSQMLNLSNATYIPETKTLTGNATLEVGNYKFIPSYGINSSQNVSLSIPPLQLLSNELSLTHSPSGDNGNNLPEIFLLEPDGYSNDVNNIQSYNMNVLGELNEPVRLTINRAVSRVDVMFIKATKNGDTYTEVQTAEGQDVFGNQGLDKMELRFTNLNQQMNLLGIKHPGTLNATIDVLNLGSSGEGLTIGSRQGASLIGTEDYIRFDSIQTDDIIYGAAHVFGTYLIPNNDESNTAGLQVYIESANRTRSRTINIVNEDENLIPLVRNKVTLIKIYILENGDDPNPPEPPGPNPPEPPGPVPPEPPGPPPSVYDADITVKVEFVDWYDSNHVSEEVDLTE